MTTRVDVDLALLVEEAPTPANDVDEEPVEVVEVVITDDPAGYEIIGGGGAPVFLDDLFGPPVEAKARGEFVSRFRRRFRNH